MNQRKFAEAAAFDVPARWSPGWLAWCERMRQSAFAGRSCMNAFILCKHQPYLLVRKGHVVTSTRTDLHQNLPK